MGFFSWRTADTGTSIMNIHSGERVRTAYMLSPGSGAPIEEPAYDGYGVFGGVDAFAHLARLNLPAERLEGLDDEQVRDLGCELDSDHHVLVADGSKHRICARDLGIRPDMAYHPETYDRPIAAFGGRSANELIASGELVEARDLPANPLKFSFRPDAVYEALPPSENCPRQGFMEAE